MRRKHPKFLVDNKEVQNCEFPPGTTDITPVVDQGRFLRDHSSWVNLAGFRLSRWRSSDSKMRSQMKNRGIKELDKEKRKSE